MLNLLRISISMIVPIALVLLCGRWLNRRFRAELKYLLWLVIALRLMVPVSVSLPEGLAQVPVLQRAGTVERQIVQRIQPEPLTAQAAPAAPAPAVPDSAPAAVSPETPAPEAEVPGVSLSQVLFWVWLAGFVLFLGYHLLANYHFRRKLRRWYQPLRDPRIRRLVASVQEELGVRQRVQVIRWEGTASPLVTGVLFPVLVLPERSLDDVSFYYVLRHEMTHIKRHDIAYQLILLLACCIHWFNPLVHLMRIQALHDMEVSCDARAIRGASRDDRITYSEALLTTAISAANSPAMLSTAFLDSKKSLKLRFREILASSGKRRRGILVLTVVLALTVLCGFTVASQVEAEAEPTDQSSVLEEQEASLGRVLPSADESGAVFASEDEFLTIALVALAHADNVTPQTYDPEAPAFVWNAIYYYVFFANRDLFSGGDESLSAVTCSAEDVETLYRKLFSLGSGLPPLTGQETISQSGDGSYVFALSPMTWYESAQYPMQKEPLTDVWTADLRLYDNDEAVGYWVFELIETELGYCITGMTPNKLDPNAPLPFPEASAEEPAEAPTAVPSQPPPDETAADPLRTESAISVEGVRFGMDDTDVIALLGEPDSQEDYETVGGHIRQLFYFGGVIYGFQQCDTCGAYHLWSMSTSDAAGEHMPLGIDTGDSVYEVLETLGVPEAEPTYRENLYTIDATHYATYHSLDDNPQLEFIQIFIGNVDWELAFGRQHQVYINNISMKNTSELHRFHTQLASSVS